MFYKVICRYGHVGCRKDVSVARYIRMNYPATIIDVMDLTSDMPGVKNKGVQSVKRINQVEYEEGKLKEADNLYLKNLKSIYNVS